MNYTEYAQKKAVGGIVSLAKSSIDVTITYDEYDRDTGEKTTSEASINPRQLREQMAHMDAEIQHTNEYLIKLTTDRNNVIKMIADVEKVVMEDVVKS